MLQNGDYKYGYIYFCILHGRYRGGPWLTSIVPKLKQYRQAGNNFWFTVSRLSVAPKTGREKVCYMKNPFVNLEHLKSTGLSACCDRDCLDNYPRRIRNFVHFFMWISFLCFASNRLNWMLTNPYDTKMSEWIHTAVSSTDPKDSHRSLTPAFFALIDCNP